MSDQAEKEEKNKNIWDVVFQPHKPVRVTFHNADFETDYVFEAKDDKGIFVRDKRKVLYIPWLAVDYIAWKLSDEKNEDDEKDD